MAARHRFFCVCQPVGYRLTCRNLRALPKPLNHLCFEQPQGKKVSAALGVTELRGARVKQKSGCDVVSKGPERRGAREFPFDRGERGKNPPSEAENTSCMLCALAQQNVELPSTLVCADSKDQRFSSACQGASCPSGSYFDIGIRFRSWPMFNGKASSSWRLAGCHEPIA